MTRPIFKIGCLLFLMTSFHSFLPRQLSGALAILSSSSKGQAPTTRARYLMGTVCEITAYGPRASEAITAAFDEMARLEQVMTLFRKNSELSRLNRTAFKKPFRCSMDLWSVLAKSYAVYRLSSGAFDPTAGSPEPGFYRVILNSKKRSVQFTSRNVRIDLGGIGKGFALDAAVAIMRHFGVRSALLNFGGQILAVGHPPQEPAWRILVSGLEAPLWVENASASSSSQEEHPNHILDPRTNQPVKRDSSITVIHSEAAAADAWSTALFISGIDRIPKNFTGCAIEVNSVGSSRSTGFCSTYKSHAFAAGPPELPRLTTPRPSLNIRRTRP